MTQNVWILLFAQAFAMCAAPLVVFAGGLIGKQLSPDPGLATLPVAAMVVGTALAVYPAAFIAGKRGRKFVFLSAMVIGMVAALVAVWAIEKRSFVSFILATTLIGSVLACIQQFRFAAMESVTVELMPMAASRLLLAGIFAAWLGPELVILGLHIHSSTFTGAFYLQVLCFVVAFGLIYFGYSNTVIEQVDSEHKQRSFTEILTSPGILLAMGSAAVAFAVMSLIMTATPIVMHEVNQFSLSDTKWVIQSHIMAMFLPSLFSGWLIRKFGFASMMWAGLLLFVLCLLAAFWGQALMNYWAALILLGLGWNLLFISGTALLPTMHNPDEAYRIQGLNDLLVFSAQALAALSSGLLLLKLGWHGLLWVVLPIILVQVFLLLNWQRSRRGNEIQKL